MTSKQMDVDEQLSTVGMTMSKAIFRRHFASYQWLLSGTSAEIRRDLFVLFAFLKNALQLLPEKATPAGTSPAWEKMRDELRHALRNGPDQPLHAALVEVIQRHAIPQQWLFDVLDGVDYWIRFGEFKTYDELAHFCAQVGGATLNALVAVVGIEHGGYEEFAVRAGRAISLVHALNHSGQSYAKDQCWIPQDELLAHGLSNSSYRKPENAKLFDRLIRSLANRIELEFFEGAPLLHYLQYDGQRILKSVFAMHWHLLNRIKQEPNHLFLHPVELSRGESIRLRLKHVLGTEGSDVPLIVKSEATHHGS